jgi:tRNA A37 threonylcarbamoyladenosine dehydratase
MSDLNVAVVGVGKMGAFHVDSLTKRTRGVPMESDRPPHPAR